MYYLIIVMLLGCVSIFCSDIVPMEENYLLSPSQEDYQLQPYKPYTSVTYLINAIKNAIKNEETGELEQNIEDNFQHFVFSLCSKAHIFHSDKEDQFKDLVDAISSKNHEKLSKILTDTPELIDVVDKKNQGLLHFAAFQGRLSAIKIIYEKIKSLLWFQTCRLQQNDINNLMPLDLAIIAGHFDVVIYFLDVCDLFLAEKQWELLMSGENLVYLKIAEHVLSKDDWWSLLSALKYAALGRTSKAMLSYLGSITRLSLSHQYSTPRKHIRKFLELAFLNYPLPKACAFIQGKLQTNQGTGAFDFDYWLSRENAKKAREYIISQRKH